MPGISPSNSHGLSGPLAVDQHPGRDREDPDERGDHVQADARVEAAVVDEDRDQGHACGQVQDRGDGEHRDDPALHARERLRGALGALVAAVHVVRVQEVAGSACGCRVLLVHHPEPRLERCVARSRGCGRWPCSWWCSSTCGPSRLPGGYVGVDVFFVISGFLITSHAAARGGPRRDGAPGRFWARRMRRLLPASYVVLAVSAVGRAASGCRGWCGSSSSARSSAAGALRRELGARAQRGRLPRRREHALAGPALLDAVGGGAVLPGLAAAGAARDLARRRTAALSGPPPSARSSRVLAAGGRCVVGVLALGDRHRPGLGLLRHPGPGLGVRRGGAARLRTGGLATLSAVARPLLGWVGRSWCCWPARWSSTRHADAGHRGDLGGAASAALIWVEATGRRRGRATGCWCSGRRSSSATSPTRSTSGTGR